MIYVRMVTARFKAGKREDAVRVIEGYQGSREDSEGYKGIMILLPNDDPDTVTVVTYWDSEDTLRASREGLYNKVETALEGLLDGSPDLKEYRLREVRSPEIIQTDVYKV